MRRLSHAAIFDLDGLLLDTEPLYTTVIEEIVSRFGKPFTWETKKKLMGKKPMDSASILLSELSIPMTASEFIKERDHLLKALLPQCTAMPGARKLVEILSCSGIPMIVATSCQRESFEHKTVHHQNWFRHFRDIITSDHPDVQRGKPAPDIFLVAAKTLGKSPECCIVFEDSPSGVEAGIAAGMTVIAVPPPPLTANDYHDAAVILPSLENFEVSEWFEIS